MPCGGLQDQDRTTIVMNGTTIQASAEKQSWLAPDVSPEGMNRGPNRLRVAFQSGQAEAPDAGGCGPFGSVSEVSDSCQ